MLRSYIPDICASDVQYVYYILHIIICKPIYFCFVSRARLMQHTCICRRNFGCWGWSMENLRGGVSVECLLVGAIMLSLPEDASVVL